jgi:hypothetical protein
MQQAMTDHSCSQEMFCGCRIINSMHHKLTFLRNPRFPSPEKHIRGPLPDHPPAASAKPLGSSRSGSPSKASLVLTLSCARCAGSIQSCSSLFVELVHFLDGKKIIDKIHVLSCLQHAHDAVPEHKSFAHIGTMQSGCSLDVCQACVVCAKCLI